MFVKYIGSGGCVSYWLMRYFGAIMDKKCKFKHCFVFRIGLFCAIVAGWKIGRKWIGLLVVGGWKCRIVCCERCISSFCRYIMV